MSPGLSIVIILILGAVTVGLVLKLRRNYEEIRGHRFAADRAKNRAHYAEQKAAFYAEQHDKAMAIAQKTSQMALTAQSQRGASLHVSRVVNELHEQMSALMTCLQVPAAMDELQELTEPTNQQYVPPQPQFVPHPGQGVYEVLTPEATRPQPTYAQVPDGRKPWEIQAQNIDDQQWYE